jgi:D-alanine-D-alanine ligase
MSIKVTQDWWKFIFDEIYLKTDARSVCNDRLTRQEVNFLEHYLKPSKNDFILDLCGGQGRHALELAQRGFRKVTVLDFSHFLLKLGSNAASQEGLTTRFVRCDARETALRGDLFHFIIIMASSFGYFVDDSENKKIIKEVFRLLRPGGLLLLDLPNREFVLHNFKANSSHQVDDDIMVIRRREIKEDVIYSEETVQSKMNGCLSIKTYCMRLYGAEQIERLLNAQKFSSVTVMKDFMSRADQGDFGSMTNRVIVTARKG